MSQVFTLDLPSDVAERAQAVATQTHRRIEEVLLEWIGRAATEIPIEWLPDAEVLALADLQMAPHEQSELSALLAAKGEGTISSEGQERLAALLQLYQAGMIRKAHALKVAVERGLRPPLSS
jgi:hypothetical protein